MSDLSHCLAILKALGVSEVIYHLSGGGDSGTCELDTVIYGDGRHAALPTVTVDITDHGEVTTLSSCLDRIVEELPDGDWINNEGGYGSVTLRPQEADEDLRVECDMTYGEDSEEADFEDDDDQFLTSDPAEPTHESEAQTLVVDDSALQPPKGETP
jgi:hypothetical protein